ncbi:MAG: transposase [Leptospiraceae bacterium]|nr:transposase [Leptospiraceae bacterium]
MDNQNKRGRKAWSADEKIEIVRKHFMKSKLVDTCEENRIHPVMLSNWWKTILESGREALLGTNKKEVNSKDKLIKKYESEINSKNEVIAELSRLLVEQKKRMGIFEWYSRK